MADYVHTVTNLFPVPCVGACHFVGNFMRMTCYLAFSFAFSFFLPFPFSLYRPLSLSLPPSLSLSFYRARALCLSELFKVSNLFSQVGEAHSQ